MTTAKDLDYRLHHLCIYDDKPRDNMFPYLRWHHGITNYFSGAVFHVTGEGHSDYTFLGCGAGLSSSNQAPPFQFEYERQWWKNHGLVQPCLLDNLNARKSMEHLLANGATEVMPFEEFPTYDGFVVHDPEGRWVEIMEYTDDTFRVQEFTHAPSGECGLELVGNAELCRNIDAMTEWYTNILDLQMLEAFESGDDKTVVLTDRDYDPQGRRTLFFLHTARHEFEQKLLAEHGPQISALVYQAKDIERAWEDALWAGMKSLMPLHVCSLTGIRWDTCRNPAVETPSCSLSTTRRACTKALAA